MNFQLACKELLKILPQPPSTPSSEIFLDYPCIHLQTPNVKSTIRWNVIIHDVQSKLISIIVNYPLIRRRDGLEADFLSTPLYVLDV